MKKIYFLFCIIGIAMPYYHLIDFLKYNAWSMNGFFELLYANGAVSMISWDLTVAALSFFAFLIYFKTKAENPSIAPTTKPTGATSNRASIQ